MVNKQEKTSACWALGCLLVIFSSNILLLWSDTSIASDGGGGNDVSRILREQGVVTSLDNSVRTALMNHPALLAKRKVSEIKSAELREVQADFLPQLYARLGIGREDSNNQTSRSQSGFGSDEYERRESSLVLRQKLYDGNKSFLLQAGKESELEASKLAYQYEMSKVALDAVKAHFTVMKSNAVLGFHEENLDTHERIAKDVGIRARSGKDDRARVNQVSARLSLALANIELAKQNRLVANSQYRATVGQLPGKNLVYRPGELPLPESRDELIRAVLQGSYLLKSEKLAERSARANYKAARAHRYPEVYVEAGASWNDNLDGVAGRNGDAYLMLRMEYELYGGGASGARQLGARLRQEQLGYELDDTKRILTSDAEQLWLRYESARARLELLQDYVDAAKSTKVAYTKQFSIGQRSLIDLLDAENELLNARRMQVDVDYELREVEHEMLFMQGNLLDGE